MAKKKQSRKSRNNRSRNADVKYNFWAAVRDITMRAIDKGQLPILAIVAIILMIIYKMPGEDISKLMFEVASIAHAGVILSYVANVVLIVICVWSCKNLRRVSSAEVKRIGNERTKLQKKLLPPDSVKGSEEQ